MQIDMGALAAHVLWLAFALAVAFGAIAQRTHFCTMGAIADIVTLGDWTRMRMWVLAMAVAILGFNAMVALGWIEARHSLYAAPRLNWLSMIVGGALFGFGMVLGSGCGSKTLVRIGGGNLKSLVVFVVMGLAAFATLKGITAVARVRWLDAVHATLPGGQDLPSLLAGATGLGAHAAALGLGALLAAALLAWVLARPEGRQRGVLAGGIGIGLVIVAVWWASGVLGHVAEDPQTLEETFVATNSHRMESLSFVAPVAYTLDWLMYFSDASQRLTLGIVAVVGVALGSAAAALAGGVFRWEGFRDAGDTASHLAGGALMGVGGVTALGCTIGQGLSGISTLAVGSFLALASIVGGAVGALRWQQWRIERSA
ncbi:MAG TPA: YeeE/YedE family protein [Burkholderiaceae bacterium]